MEKEKWIAAIQDFNKLSELSLEEIKELVDQFPFAQNLHLLLAKKSQILKHPDFEQNLFSASAHHADRAWLFDRMNASTLEKRNKKKKKKKGKKKKAEKKQESKAGDKAKISKKEEQSSQKLIETNKPNKEKKEAKPGETKQLKSEKETQKSPEPKLTKEEKSMANIQASLEKKKKRKSSIKEIHKLESSKEIKPSQEFSDFTNWLLSLEQKESSEPEIPGQTAIESATAEEILDEDSDLIISEPLADLMAEQGHIKKAINMYKKLSLLNPAKSVYFARKIENLKKKDT